MKIKNYFLFSFNILFKDQNIFTFFLIFVSFSFSALNVKMKGKRSPQRSDEPKCGTADMNYQPCTSKSVANKLFLACCEQFVAPECHFYANMRLTM
ncbi:DB domain-containing protein [Meloidogyne graminicola]|uniref:DB domain-containing protein n=1 Tax=Meloidogyne graminicola TaxID=189291 RepID=A0A8S9ZUS8_9BILA|nr:DB domain-containing protein [Meloidogyne graminicola]